MESVSDRFSTPGQSSEHREKCMMENSTRVRSTSSGQIPFCLAGSKRLHHTQTPATQKLAAGVSLGESRKRSPHYYLKMFIF